MHRNIWDCIASIYIHVSIRKRLIEIETTLSITGYHAV